jgi:hypothetical protein
MYKNETDNLKPEEGSIKIEFHLTSESYTSLANFFSLYNKFIS